MLLPAGVSVFARVGERGLLVDLHVHFRSAASAASLLSNASRTRARTPPHPGQVPVGAVDHLHARPHPPREGEQRYSCSKAERRIGVSQVVDPLLRLDPRGADRRLPLPRPPVVQRHVAAPQRREQQRRVEPRRQGFQGVEHSQPFRLILPRTEFFSRMPARGETAALPKKRPERPRSGGRRTPRGLSGAPPTGCRPHGVSRPIFARVVA
jgi:hypothetical protein